MRITIQTGNEAGRGYTVDHEMTAGRAVDNDIVLTDADISAYHARFRPNGSGIEVSDSGSRNGTFVNGTRITAATPLRPGDELRLASRVMIGAEESGTVVSGGGWAANSLVVRTGREAGGAVILGEGQLVSLGREAGNTLVLSDPRVSSRHALVTRNGDNIRIEDLGSANGTLVNGAQIGGSATARDGAEIQVGETIMVFYKDAHSAAYEPQPTVVGSITPMATSGVIAAVEARTKKRSRAPLVAAGVVVLLAVAAGAAFTLLSGGDDNKDLTVTELVEKARPSVVHILNLQDDGSGGQGSGSVVDAEDGLIITNNHVATGGTLHVLNENIRGDLGAAAILIAAAPCDDLALVQVTEKSKRKSLVSVVFGDAKGLKQGQQVVALGFPASAESGAGDRLDSLSATSGIISKNDTVYDNPGDVPKLAKAIQHQAAVNPGNSGGPLFDLTGKQIGVNTAIFFIAGRGRAEGENYAVSVERIDELLPKMKRGYSPKWIGTAFGLAVNTQTQEPAGLIIEGITPGSPAVTAGLKVDDIIIEVDGKKVTNLHTYCEAMPEKEGEQVSLTVQTGRTLRKVDVTAGNPKSKVR